MPGDAGTDLLAAAYALGYLKAAGGDSINNRVLMEYARGLTARLVVSQRDDGGWSRSHGSSGSDIYVSSRSLWALSEAQSQGINVHAQTIEKALSTLGEILCGGQGKQSGWEKRSKERIQEEGLLLLLPRL